jgi:hypothetical protein
LQPSEVNREWNEHTLLLMQRAGLIRILDSKDKTLQPYATRSNSDSGLDEALWLPLELLNPEIVNNRLDFENKIKPYREQERTRIEQDLDKMRGLVTTYSGREVDRCIAYQLGRLYPDCALACGGCPACRNKGRPAYSEKFQLEIHLTPALSPYTLRGELAARLGRSGTLNLFWEGQPDLTQLPDLPDFLVNLVKAGFRQFILPDTLLEDPGWAAALVQKLAYLDQPVPHLIAGVDWPGRLPLYPVPTALVYPPENAGADLLFQAWRATRRDWPAFPVVNVINRNLYLESEHGYFTDRVNGSVERLDQWQLALALEF